MPFDRVAPNGQTVEFPDGTSEKDVQRYLALQEFQPQQPKQINPQDRKLTGVGDFAYDLGVRGGLGGVRDSFQSNINLLESMAESGKEDSFWTNAIVFGENADNGFIGVKSKSEMKAANIGYAGFGKIGEKDAVNLPEVDRPKTLVGDLTRGVSQFATSWYTGGKLLKTVGAGKALTALGNTGKWGKFAELSTRGAVGDFIGFDEDTGRLVDLINEKAPILANPIFDYLASDKEDTWLEGRMKNALEGFLIGGTLDIAVRGIRWGKNKWKKDNGFEYDKKIYDEDTKFLQELKQEQLTLKDASQTTVTKEFADEFTKNLEQGLEDGIFRRFRFAQEFSSNRKGFAENVSDLNLSLDFNMRQMKQLNENGLLTVDAWNKATEKLIQQKKIVVSDAQLKKMATNLYQDNLGRLEVDVRQLEELMQKAPARIIALNSYKQTLENGLKYTALHGADNREVQEFVFGVLLPKYKYISESKKSIASNVGRSLRVINEGGNTIIAKDIDTALKDFENFKNINDPAARAELIRRISLAGDADITKVLDYIINNRTINVANEIWINMLLSNPKTHIINMTSNVMNIFLRPLERAVGSRLYLPFLEDADKIAKLKGEFAPAISSYVRMKRHLMDSFKAAKSAFVNEEGIITSRNKLDVPDRAIQKTKIENGKVVEDYSSVSGKVINTTGKVVRMSNRFLTAEDELFKQVVYRGELEADAIARATRNNLDKTKIVATDLATGRKLTEFEAYVLEQMQKGFDDTGKATRKDILRLAEETTFTQDLDGIFEMIQNTVNNYPILKQIIPFVKTPVNLMLNITDRTGLGFARKTWRDDFFGKNGARRMAQARGGLVTGYSLILWASMLWKEGMITGTQGQVIGEASTNAQDLKDLRRQTGVQPNSFRIYDEEKGTYKYINYGRFDPFGSFLSLVADYNTFYDQMTQQEAARAGSNLMIALARNGGKPEDYLDTSTKLGMKANALFSSFSRNVFSKTYIKGLADFMEAITDDRPDKIGRYLRTKVGSFIPNFYTKVLNDEFIRDTKDIFDEIKKRTGWEEVEYKFDFRGNPLKMQGGKLLNFVNGVFNPFSYSEKIDDPVADEILRLGINMPKINDKLGGDIDLNKFVSAEGQTAYNRVQQHLRNVTFYNGKTLDQALRDEIKSEEYKQLGDPTGVDELNKDIGGKARRIKSIISKYQKEAELYLKNEANKFISTEDKSGKFSLQNSIEAVNRNVQKLKTGVQVNVGDLEGLYNWSK